MKIAFIASEAVPFVKSGGIADVVGALSKTLAARGHEVIVILPKYGAIDQSWKLTPFLNTLGVWMGDTEEWCSSFTAAESGFRFYFIEFEKYFGRKGLYSDAGFREYDDNARRFGLFGRAALQLCRDANFKPDIVHAHDWQTALWRKRKRVHDVGYQTCTNSTCWADSGGRGSRIGNSTPCRLQ